MVCGETSVVLLLYIKECEQRLELARGADRLGRFRAAAAAIAHDGHRTDPMTDRTRSQVRDVSPRVGLGGGKRKSLGPGGLD